ncbi:poly-beta-1,6 N-acetyl-D-glucosamine synthase [Aneurinibacillus soli]|uniref:Poly-beta-1,6-N-acetyl-D-glucosamine synthase n=2 Tax=Aneurinibacillus soli TaxID=1500254 RepID=A0A0U4NDR2_9BACL|nr:glycosyltransferase [Aneurinibacillus soli]PYE62514.1 poly-beta-1,6 N-acetyl-D-glucosamine synthase [Aneurinibacillus soli]BAU27076.1 Poly-beta-1,6-N-acetyl-D-glucosamine synthase [Aneurinibacillus soli]
MINEWIPYIHIVEIILVIALVYFLFTSLYRKKMNRTEKPETKNFIFYDDSGRRWSLIKRLGIVFGIASVLVLCVFGFSLNSDPSLPRLSFNENSKFALISPIIEKINERSLIAQLKEEEKKHPTFQLDFKKHHKDNKVQSSGQKEVYGFYVNWDENSKISLKKNIRSLTTVIPEWYHLTSSLTLQKDVQPDVKKLAADNHVKVMPLINNFVNGKWDAALVHNLLVSPESRKKVIDQLYTEAKTNGYSGFNIDFESIDPKDQDALTAFMGELSHTFHAAGLQLTEDVPAKDDAFDYGALAKVTDRMIVMLYDEHYQTGKPGPIASSSWFEKSLDQLDIPPDKLIVSLGSYGYDWTENSSDPADVVTFGDIMDMASASHLHIQWDQASQNPYVRYKEGEDQHIIWFLDGVSLYNEWKMSHENGAKGVALWRLGSEDPTVWNVLNQPDQFQSQVNTLHTLTSPEPVHYSGDGEILQITSSAKDGERDFSVDEDGTLSGESYTTYPSPFQISRYGKAAGKQVVLTFDDGPDPEYTPKILDILDRYHIKGSFFIVGENAQVNPDIIRRMYREGHEIGSHTFTHPNVAAISPIRAKMELNANQRLFQELTGHSMTMFRPPYVADSSPSTPEELLPILRAQQMGYTMVGEAVDPEDWQDPSSDEIVRRVMKELPDGNIILLHDAGGDRSHTVEALPKLIEKLQHMGYTFTTVHQLLGKTPNDLMPVVEHTESPFMTYDKTVFTAVSGWQKGIAFLFYLSIGVGMIRFLVLIYLASRQKRRSRARVVNMNFTPPVSVVIAAYNEEKVIAKTIHSILESNYPDFEIIVVDDGSTDRTAEVVKETFREYPYVKLISKENGGKSSAVNRGFMEASGDIVIALDADTLIAPDAIALLTRHFVDPNIAAVSGNVKVGNTRNLLTKWQQVEYVTGFNLDRRAFDELNCIAVVPGAIGAWRKKAVAEVGYFQEDTLAEDTDITLTLLRNGYRIMYEERAYAYTEAPEDVRSLLKQRYRWTYGTLQCLWKHRGALFNRKQKSLGFVGLPNMWLFQYVFQLIAPLADILFVMGLFGVQPQKTLLFYVVFFLVDFLASFYAFRLEEESPKPLIWLFLQRIIYRQFMTYVVIKSIGSALRGITVGWNKLKRLGSAVNK